MRLQGKSKNKEPEYEGEKALCRKEESVVEIVLRFVRRRCKERENDHFREQVNDDSGAYDQSRFSP